MHRNPHECRETIKGLGWTVKEMARREGWEIVGVRGNASFVCAAGSVEEVWNNALKKVQSFGNQSP